MGTLYAKAVNRSDLKKLPLDPDNLWEYVEELHLEFDELFKRIERTEEELMTLQKNKPTGLTQPQVTKNTWRE